MAADKDAGGYTAAIALLEAVANEMFRCGLHPIEIIGLLSHAAAQLSSTAQPAEAAK